jgi:hypothetical protein
VDDFAVRTEGRRANFMELGVGYRIRFAPRVG